MTSGLGGPGTMHAANEAAFFKRNFPIKEVPYTLYTPICQEVSDFSQKKLFLSEADEFQKIISWGYVKKRKGLILRHFQLLFW
jgi:hypothetical protein